ncbi:MAG: hypothetical protein D8M57_10475 [Candidatus Scalindua sp. AMX11]|nr:MAG: hypothetical protein DWQ00_01610 [Candidatus Scalindua sp.]NOG85522.1 hypothetical protein [Planctomycetota bacterium]RZV90229.1 MAG: hypothetical protein EX341_06220 [Candidatus Scalindua sp. SCAELEC01]TDE65014.1 MAG: hypothetical protein D8M57_10475 [Candidatus Scalindua sp. AMX11]GJQ59551.1 MAG: hypothetical protein SCALA701_23520 [Candidatus Scalindua sp.]
MAGRLDVETVKDEIRSTKDARLRSIIDILAFKISKDSHDSGAENNMLTAEETLAEYILEKFSGMDGFHESLLKIGKGIKGIQVFAEDIYQYFCQKDHLNFHLVKDSISSNKDILLKTITDLVAYKISQSSNDKGPEMNFITAQTFVAEYVSKFFKSRRELEKEISKFGNEMKGLRSFSDTVYDYFVDGEA